jgi:iron complex transport system permease protein
MTLALVGPALWQAHRALDLLAVDEDTARVVGVPVDRARPVLLGVACLLNATAVCAVGVIAFVGLVAPHARPRARGGRSTGASCRSRRCRSRAAGVGGRHARPHGHRARTAPRRAARGAGRHAVLRWLLWRSRI